MHLRTDPVERRRTRDRPRTSGRTAARVLIVEDDDDTRELLAVMLGFDGYDVVQAADTEAAMAALRQGEYGLLITDYDLPGETGAQLLRRAARERILGGCAVLVVTAHPDPSDLEGTSVIAKPVDIETFRHQIHQILEPRTVSPPVGPHGPPAGSRLTIVLYVDRQMPASQKAERNARRILGEVAESIDFEVRDVRERPHDAEADRVVFTPALVAKCTPPIWILGDLREPDALRDVLDLCGAA